MKVKHLIIAGLLSHTLDSDAQFTKLVDFTGTANGSSPSAELYSDGTFLYGTTYDGGASNLGTVFKIKPDGTGYVNLLSFSGTSNGANPGCTLISDGTYLYGTTSYGGTGNKGTVFKIKPDGTGYMKLLDFNGTNGNHPDGGLEFDGVYLYGTTYYGGSATTNYGCLFRVKTDGTSYANLWTFDNSAAKGGRPAGSLYYDGTYLYSTTQHGGTVDFGILFKILTNGTGFVKLHDFTGTGTDGKYPYYGRPVFDGTYLYGATAYGGSSNLGVVYKIKPDGTSYSTINSFTGTASGSLPTGQLFLAGTMLYGMASTGGANGMGTIYQIRTDGTAFANLHDFSGSADGSTPYGGIYYDGFDTYGMTKLGGTSNTGVLFKFHATGMGIEDGDVSDLLTIYPNPSNGQVHLKLDQLTTLKTKNISVVNSLGEKVYGLGNNQISNSQDLELDLSGLANGVYFIHLSTEQGMLNKKIVINR